MKIAFDWDEWTNEIYTGQDYKKQSNKNKIFFFVQNTQWRENKIPVWKNPVRGLAWLRISLSSKMGFFKSKDHKKKI